MKKILMILIAVFLILPLVSALLGSIGYAKTIIYPQGSLPQTIEKTILVKNINNVSVEITLSLDANGKEFLELIDDNFILQPNENKTARFLVYINDTINYEGNILVEFSANGESSVILPATIKVIQQQNQGSSTIKDIAYILKDSSRSDTAFTSAITEAGYTYDLIDDSKITSTNFSKYGMILVGDGNFGSLAASIPVNKVNSLIANTYHMDEWNWITDGTASTGGSQPLDANIINLNSIITQGIPVNFQVYTQAKDNGVSIPMYYLSKSKRSLNLRGEVSTESDSLDYAIATADKGTILKKNNISQAKGVFFGITESEFWTQDSKNLFKNSIKWIIGDQDQDADTYPAKNDCNDHDAAIHPGVREIAYDYIDQNCDGYDLADVDRDGYCLAEYNIANKDLQCAKETGTTGTDCNDNDALTYPGATDERKDCINKAPVFNGNLTKVEWNEDSFTSVDLDSYFSDPDADRLNYSVQETSTNENVMLEFLSNGVLKFSSTQYWYGEDWVIFKSQDPSGLSALSSNVTLKVNHVNHAPIIQPIGVVYGVEGQLVEININASDSDGDSLSYSANSNKFELNGNVLKWQTQIGDAGDYSIVIKVDDGKTEISQEVQIGIFKKVLINEFVSDPSQGREWVEIYNPGDKSFSLSNCVLIDSADHTLTLDGSVQAKKFAVFEYSSNVLNNDGDKILLYCYEQLIDAVSYGNYDDGNAEDNAPAPGKGESAGRDPDGKDTGNNKENFKIFNLPTKGLPNNSDLNPPTVTLISPENGKLYNETRDITFEFKGTDNSADKLICEFFINESSENSGEFSNNTVSSFSINGIEDGYYFWNVKCYDELSSAFAEDNWNFRISAPNNPIINVVGDKEVNETQTLEFAVNAFDNDGNLQSLIIENKPEGANFVYHGNGQGIFSWTPSYTQAGNYSITFVAEDTTGLKASRTVKIIVSDVKAPPTFSDADTCSVKSGNIEISITNPDKGDKFKIGGTIKADVKIKNSFQEDLSFDVHAYLYDLDGDKSVDDQSDSLDVDRGKSGTAKLELDIPKDADNKDYAVYVYVEDENSNCNSNFVEIKIQREKDDVVIENIDVSPKIASPGDSVDVNVKVRNLGSNDQDDAYIKLEILDLQVSKESDTFKIEKYDEDDTATKSFTITLPKDAAEKEYELTATVFYSGEEDSNTSSFLVTKKLLITTITAPEELKGELIQLDNRLGTAVQKNAQQIQQNKEIAKKPQVNINLTGLGSNDLLMVIDVMLIIGILIEIIMMRIVTRRR